LKLEKKKLISINGKKKFKRILVEGESCLQRTSSLCFLHGGELALF